VIRHRQKKPAAKKARLAMSFEAPSLLFQYILNAYSKQIPIMIGLALLFTMLTVFRSQQASPGKVWWRNPGLSTDVSYGLIHGLIGPYFKLPALIIATNILMGMMPEAQVQTYFAEGRGPLSGLPFYWQVAFYVIVTDFLHYWIHRAFHDIKLWRFHAIHHSATQVDWTTTYRIHPINAILQPASVTVLMMLLGIAPSVMLFTLPFDVLTAAWVHSNLKWNLGPLKYVIAGPVFHRWHHGLPGDGGDKNFAPTFSLWDYMFGTFYMPEGRIPENFGTDDHHFPEGYFAQLVYPFAKKPSEAIAPAKIVAAE
jgi:sterol desaturase/sphingolipid hydroxylase (fatty acid hydroxylase superfamily)